MLVSRPRGHRSSERTNIMTRVFSLSTRLLAISCVAALLSGCATNAIFPDAGSPLPESVPLGSFHGSVYGGHAPIVNSRIFVLQAGTSGYGGMATSLLTNIAGVTTLDNTGDATNGMYYVTTNAQGYFNITGDYTCTPGLPVYLYGAGGVSSLASGNGLTSYSVSGSSITFGSYNLVSVGQYVSFVGMPAALSGLDSGTYLVTAATPENDLTNTPGSFTITASGYSNGATGTLASNNSIAYIVTSTSNPAIVNLAVLGNCPTTGAANFSSLNYVYMNEVSTVAAAYALAGYFTNSSCSTTYLCATDAVHLSIPVENSYAGVALGTSPSWQGIENAALVAGQLYNIQGLGSTSTTGDGEGHIANLTTASGGTVSQALIDAIANSLAACVDSGNTGSPTSAPCSTLFSDALSNTTVGGIPTNRYPQDTATVAINLAHNPWTDKASAILGLATGTAPYLPYAATATDLAVTISYPMTGIQSGSKGGVAIDAQGNPWVTSFGNYSFSKLAPYSTTNYLTDPKAFTVNLGSPLTPGMLAFDSKGDAWVSVRNLDAYSGHEDGAYKYTSTGAEVAGSPFASGNVANLANGQANLLYDDIWVAVDANDNAYFSQHVYNNALELSSSGAVVGSFSSGPDGTAVDLFASTSYDGPFGLALDTSANVYMTTDLTYNTFGIYSQSNPTVPSPFITYTAVVGTEPQGLALDASGNAWFTDGSTGSTSLYEVKKGATTATQILSANTSGYGNGGVSSAVNIAIDASGLLFASNPTGSSTGLGDISVFTTTGSGQSAAYLTSSNGLRGSYVSSGTTYTPMQDPYVMALDGSGNLWVNTNTTLVQFVGVATPVLTPVSANLKNSVIIEKP